MSLLVIVPSRGRPQNAKRLIDAFDETDAHVDLLFAVDHDDPPIKDYLELDHRADVRVGTEPGMAATLNAAAVENAWRYDAIGFLGDDHRPRTHRWDEQIQTALDELGTGIVYGNDLLQGANLPTAVFMTTDIIQTIGWMALPGAKHLFLDNTWKVLGETLGALRYLPDVIIEHLHPCAGKTDWDDGYARVNAGDVWEHDRAVYEQWLAEGLPRDVARIRDGRVAAVG